MFPQSYDALIIGAGFSGAVVAHQLAQQGKSVLLLEQRSHIGGNCHEELDPDTGLSIHTYGPHLFHTDSQLVLDFLSQFTTWRPYRHKVQAEIMGRIVPLPFSFSTIRKLWDNTQAETLIKLLQETFPGVDRIPILELRKATQPAIKDLADFIFENVFRNYSAKQWGLSPESIDPQVTARVPVLLSDCEDYFTDAIQCMPTGGMNPIFAQLLAHSQIQVQLNTPFQKHLRINERMQLEWEGQVWHKPVVFTGALDDLLEHRYGHLPYRTLAFEMSAPQSTGLPVAVVNYPNAENFTRITDSRILCGMDSAPQTRLIKEFPLEYSANQIEQIPYYPLFTDSAKSIYHAYQQEALKIPNLFPLGRLAEYKYYDMDDAIESALKLAQRLLQQKSPRVNTRANS